MIKSESGLVPTTPQTFPVCNLKYLTEMMGCKNHLIVGIMDAFLTQIPEELGCMADSLEKADFNKIKSLAHTMKSSVSIMGISLLTPLLQEMEDLGRTASSIERIKELNLQLRMICSLAVKEIETERSNYI